jgi:hypothetical protein
VHDHRTADLLGRIERARDPRAVVDGGDLRIAVDRDPVGPRDTLALSIG